MMNSLAQCLCTGAVVVLSLVSLACTEAPLCAPAEEATAMADGITVESATFYRETFSTRMTTSVDASGKATYQESSPDAPEPETFTFQLSSDEQAALLSILDHPALRDTVSSRDLPCVDGEDYGVKIGLQFSDGTAQTSLGLLSCLTSPQELDMGQAGYQVSQLFAMHRKLAIEHLDCPHPGDSTDGLRESAPDGLGTLCSWVWQELENDEQIACRDGTIAKGVIDCH